MKAPRKSTTTPGQRIFTVGSYHFRFKLDAKAYRDSFPETSRPTVKLGPDHWRKSCA